MTVCRWSGVQGRLWKAGGRPVANGGVIEIVQPYFGRQAEWADFRADGFGAVLGGAIGYAVSGLLLWRS